MPDAARVMTWVKGRERAVLIVAVVLQLAVLGGMVAVRSLPLISGRTILLRVVPVDPRDLFRGEYVILSYEISSIPPRGIEGERAPQFGAGNDWTGRTVYVTLVPDGRHWRADRYSFTPPASGPFIRGTVAGWGRLQFGIESYYVQEGRGREYEQAILSRRLSAEVVLAGDGTATLKGLRVE
jgi:uncharacterized membrane-anchored protein